MALLRFLALGVFLALLSYSNSLSEADTILPEDPAAIVPGDYGLKVPKPSQISEADAPDDIASFIDSSAVEQTGALGLAKKGKVSKDGVTPEGAEHSLFEEENSVPASQLETSAKVPSAEQTRIREYTDHQRNFALKLTLKLESEFSRQKDNSDRAHALLSAKRVGLAIHHQILGWMDEGGGQLAETKSKQMEEKIKDLTEEQQHQYASQLVDTMVEHPYYKHLRGPYLLEVHAKTSTKLIGITLMSVLLIAKACAFAAAKMALSVALRVLPNVMKMSMRYAARYGARFGSKFARWFAKRVPKNLAKYSRKFLETAKRWSKKCNSSKFCQSLKRKIKKEIKKEIKERIRNSLEDTLDRVAGETCGIPQPCADAWPNRYASGYRHLTEFDIIADSLTDCANKANYQSYHGSGTHGWHFGIDGVSFKKDGTCRMFAWMNVDDTVNGEANPEWVTCSLQRSCRTVVKAHFATQRYEQKGSFQGGSVTSRMERCAAYVAYINDGANAANCYMDSNNCICYAFYATKASPGAIKECKISSSTYDKCASKTVESSSKNPAAISGLQALERGVHGYDNYYSCVLWPADEDLTKKNQRRERDKKRSRSSSRRRARGRRILAVPTPLPALADTPVTPVAPVGRQLLGSKGTSRRRNGVHPDQGLCYWESINSVISPCRIETITEGQPTSGTDTLMADKSISLEDCAVQVAATDQKYNAVSIQKYLHGRTKDEFDCFGWEGSHGGVAHNYQGSYTLETCMLETDFEIDSRKFDSNYNIAPEYLTCNDVTSGDYLPVETEAECRKACGTFRNSIFYRGFYDVIPAGCSVTVESDTPERLSSCYWNTNSGSQPQENYWWPKTRNVCRKNDDCIDPVDGQPHHGRGTYLHIGSASSLDDCASKVVASDSSYVAAQIQRFDSSADGTAYDCFGWRGVPSSDFRENYYRTDVGYELASCMLNANGQMAF